MESLTLFFVCQYLLIQALGNPALLYNFCLLGWTNLDVVILVDRSCPITMQQCQQQQNRIAETLISFKGVDEDNFEPNIRTAYIEYGHNDDIEIIIKLNQSPYNSRQSGGVTQEMIDEYYGLINSTCDQYDHSSISQRGGDPNLNEALKNAFKQFDKAGSDDKRRDKKILIFSSCEVSQDGVDEICKEFEDDVGNRGDVGVLMVNIGDIIEDPDTYIMCLVNYDEQRIFIDDQYDNTLYQQQIVPAIWSELCSQPTPAPSVDPTIQPTTTTDNPTTPNPTTFNPTTSNPTTFNPTTEMPTTSGPTTFEPTTSNPTTSNPTTSQPTTTKPTTTKPTTSSPTTSDPTTATPTTSEPTTFDPTTAVPTTSGPTSARPTSAVPTTSEPTTAGPTTSNPTTSDPTTAQPTTDEPTTDEPTTDEPTTADPTTADPTSATPTTAVPTTQNPTTSAPTTFDPTSSAPTTDNPTTSKPTSAEPTTANPTTADPTTFDPTTADPTTSAPTTNEPTTNKPTTNKPTTNKPTTSDPTSSVPTTSNPTTVSPTSSNPTSSSPTTREPTTEQPSTVPVDCSAKLMDVIIIVDISSSMTYTKCKIQQERVSEAVLMLKPVQNDTLSPNVRVSVIEMSTNDVYIRVDINEYPYNRETGVNAHREILELKELINDYAGQCYLDREDELLSRQGNPNLYDALICSLNQFDFDNKEREKHIIIYSNEKTDATGKVCKLPDNNNKFINIDTVIMYNQNSGMNVYLNCLIKNHDDSVILTNPGNDDNIYSQQILPQFEKILCSHN